jgi:hypothetical protein
MNRLVDVTTSQITPPIVLVHLIFTLRRLYVRIPLASTIRDLLVQLFSLSGPCINLLEHLNINDPNNADLDVTYFMMFTKIF